MPNYIQIQVFAIFLVDFHLQFSIIYFFQTLSLMANSTTTQLSDAAKSASKAYDMSVKDGIVIGFMLGLWLYSIILMFRQIRVLSILASLMKLHQFFFFLYRAWSKILNFSDDQVGRPEKAAVLWKWLIERLRKSKKEKPPGQHLSVSSPYKDRSVLLPSIKGFSKERLSLLGKVNDHTSYIERAESKTFWQSTFRVSQHLSPDGSRLWSTRFLQKC